MVHLFKNKMNSFKKNYLFNLIFLFLAFLIISYGIAHIYTNKFFSSYSFSELFINYQSGFIRRGLFGEMFWQINSFFTINPKYFFGLIFLFLNIAQLFLYFKILSFNKNKFLLTIYIIFFPSLLLFGIYDYKVYFLKDIFVKISILLHAFIIIYLKYYKKKEIYCAFLIYLIIPLLVIISLIHEYQVVFLSVHILFSYYYFKNYLKKKIYYLKYYFILLILSCLLIYFNGTEEQYIYLNEIIKQFNAELHPQLFNGFYKLIGGFYKWHFFYFGYKDFLNFFFSIILSLLIPACIFYEVIDKRKFSFGYYLFFIPTFITFLNLDHGRNISLLCVHLILFFLVIGINNQKYSILIKKIKGNSYLFLSTFLFIFFHIFLWKLDQYAGFGGKEQINSIFQSSLFREISNFIKFTYNFIDLNIFNLPEIKL
jgi:hypothetical protein